MHGDAAVMFKLGFPLFLIGLALIVISIKMKEKLRRYEFNNRTSGGAVEFSSYEASRSHETKWRLARVIMVFGVIPFLMGSCSMAIGLLNG